MMFWLISLGYLVMTVATMKAIFIYQIHSNLKKNRQWTPARSRAWVMEMDMPYVIFGGIFWFITLPVIGAWKVLSKTIFGETSIEKKARLEIEKRQREADAADAARVLLKEGWKV